MTEFYYITVIFVSLGAAFFSGLLGIGGGIIIFPAFLYLMPLLGFNAFTVNEITGIAAAQSLAGVTFSFMNHRKHGTVNFRLVKTVLPAGIFGALSGALVAKVISEQALLFMYLILLIIAGILILLPRVECSNTKGGCSFDRPVVTNLLILGGTFVSGALGFAGAVTFIPILNHFCRAPIKVAISTTTFVVMISTALVFAGKAAVGLVPFDLILFIIIGAFFGAAIGAKLNRILSATVLRVILFGVILILGTRILLTLLEG